MSRRVTFKLYDKDAAGNVIDELGLSLAFQRHCQRELDIHDDLNLLVKKVWLKFLRDAVDKSASKQVDLEKAGVANEARATDDRGDTPAVAVESSSPALDEVAVPTDAPSEVTDPTSR